jgi:hypothetical protein
MGLAVVFLFFVFRNVARHGETAPSRVYHIIGPCRRLTCFRLSIVLLNQCRRQDCTHDSLFFFFFFFYCQK